MSRHQQHIALLVDLWPTYVRHLRQMGANASRSDGVDVGAGVHHYTGE